MFNIGAESQLASGGFLAALVGLALPAGTPAIIAVLICLVAAAAGGGVVGAIPGALKARFGASEVIVTIMLNFIVLALLNYIVAAHIHVAETLHTPEIRAGAMPRLAEVSSMFAGSAANTTFLFALAAAAATWWYLFRTRPGYELRAVGLQPDAAEYGGVRVGSVWAKAMIVSGALAGLGGVNYVLGYKHYYEEGFGTGSGFLGIAVALVGTEPSRRHRHRGAAVRDAVAGRARGERARAEADGGRAHRRRDHRGGDVGAGSAPRARQCAARPRNRER